MRLFVGWLAGFLLIALVVVLAVWGSQRYRFYQRSAYTSVTRQGVVGVIAMDATR